MKPLAAAIAALALAVTSAYASAQETKPSPPGDALVVDADAFGTGAIFQAKLDTGQTTPYLTGGRFSGPAGIAISPSQDVFVANERGRAIIRRDARTGTVTTIAQGGLLSSPV